MTVSTCIIIVGFLSYFSLTLYIYFGSMLLLAALSRLLIAAYFTERNVIN